MCIIIGFIPENSGATGMLNMSTAEFLAKQSELAPSREVVPRAQHPNGYNPDGTRIYDIADIPQSRHTGS